jgi:hypothetical protein
MTMRGAALRTAWGLGVLLGCGLLGCVTPPSAPFQPDPPNPFLEEILKQEVLPATGADGKVLKGADGKEIRSNPPVVKPDVVLREIPLRTPLAEARKIMERHGFTCYGGIRDQFQDCVYCRAYRRKSTMVADRVVVKLFYENERVVNVVVTVENGVKRSDTLWPEF